MNVGILGAGQLARMMVLAGTPLGLNFRLFDPAPDACAGALSALTLGSFHDTQALAQFAAACEVLTFDFENVPASTLELLEVTHRIVPNSRALAMTQDRLIEKKSCANLGIPVVPHAPVNSAQELAQAIFEVGLPGILKTRRLGYDGKGQVRIRAAAAAAAALTALHQAPCVYERWMPFKRELSLLTVRASDGTLGFYPLVENIHEQGILSVSIAPAEVSAGLAASARDYAKRVAEHFAYVGVFALEFFEIDGALVLNEMAPRVHNSGHWTIEGARTSQFENHLRALAGLPLGDTQAIGASLMLNWVGTLPSRAAALSVPGLHWHEYGKPPREGRKLGHATLCARDFAELRSALDRLAEQLPDCAPVKLAQFALAEITACHQPAPSSQAQSADCANRSAHQ